MSTDSGDSGSPTYVRELWNWGDNYASLGITHLGARFYDPSLGRFMQRDPLILASGGGIANPYSFAGNDPINSADPNGLEPFPEGETTGRGDWNSGVFGVGMYAAKQIWNAFSSSPPVRWFSGGSSGSAQSNIQTTSTVAASPTPGGSVAVNEQNWLVSALEWTGGVAVDAAHMTQCVWIGCNVANAPGPRDRLIPSPSLGEEATNYAMYAGGYAVGKGIGWLGKRVLGPWLAAKGTSVLSAEGKALLSSNPIGSALKSDRFHLSARFFRQEAAANGTHFSIIGGDNVTRTLTQISGELDGISGRFEYIVDSLGNLTHQMFVRGGKINGIPIEP